MSRLKLGLSKEQLAERRNGIGGSDAKIIMEGDPAALIQLWEEKLGVRDGEDLSRVLPVQLGSFTEEFSRYWFELTTGRLVTNEGEARQAQTYPFMRCTLDGLTTDGKGGTAVFEAKHCSAFQKIEEIAARYQPQLHHSMHVTGLRHAVLSVLIGNHAYEAIEIECDEFYLAQLIDREREFWRCVETGEPPAAMSAVAPPVLPNKYRTVDMTGNNAWASRAAEWLKYRDGAKAFEIAAKDLKSMVEPDVGTASGYGLQAKRAKNGAITISELKAAKEAA